MPASDKQIGGSHYTDMEIQPWDALEAWTTKEQYVGYLLCSAIAYLARFNAVADGKGGIDDIKKAEHYLQKLIDVVELDEISSRQTISDTDFRWYAQIKNRNNDG